MLHAHTIKEQAYALGFDTVRITTAEEFPEAERIIKDRIARGLMDGLPWFTAERADVSCHPDALLPGAQSIIALGMVYLTEQPEEETVKGTADLESDECNPYDSPRGRIARYAWGDDYH